MWRRVLLFNLILCPFVLPRRSLKDKSDYDNDAGDLITSLRDDANLDLPMDEEYEDLRAELLAYHTALASITGQSEDGPVVDLNEVDSADTADTAVATPAAPEAPAPLESVPNTRRSLKTTPCWQLGGVCVYHKLCKGHTFKSEVYGCQRNLEVCCFAWNKYQTRDFDDKGLTNLALPWGHREEFGGKGLISSVDNVQDGNKWPGQDLSPQVSNHDSKDDLEQLSLSNSDSSASSETQQLKEKVIIDKKKIKFKKKGKINKEGDKYRHITLERHIPPEAFPGFHLLPKTKHPSPPDYIVRNRPLTENRLSLDVIPKKRPLAIEYRVVPGGKQKNHGYQAVKHAGEVRNQKIKRQRDTETKRLYKNSHRHPKPLISKSQEPILLIIKQQQK